MFFENIGAKTIQPSLEEEFSSHLVRQATIQRTSKEGLLKIYIRHCGMVDVLTNDQGVSPKEGMRIEYYQLERCVITNWRKQK